MNKAISFVAFAVVSTAIGGIVNSVQIHQLKKKVFGETANDHKTPETPESKPEPENEMGK